MVALGTKAPDFSLPNVVSGTTVSLQDIKSDRATLVMFICNHCPFVKHVMDELVQLGRDYIPKGVSVIAISSNDAEQYPDDSPEEMKKLAQEKSFPFPYLYDETQQVAKAFDAACTPDFYILDGSLSIVYRGQLDDSRPGNDVPVTGKDIRTALDALLSGSPVSQEQRPSLGCNIKWK
ncbi:redoxin domain-containing protein [Paenibacillus turpanensis]|uniref:redoxin domain-containing protein n=1 Tax=Paenibacillus turpanensis TaxID=2689078 RepID=UPI0014095D1E